MSTTSFISGVLSALQNVWTKLTSLFGSPQSSSLDAIAADNNQGANPATAANQQGNQQQGNPQGEDDDENEGEGEEPGGPVVPGEEGEQPTPDDLSSSLAGPPPTITQGNVTQITPGFNTQPLTYVPPGEEPRGVTFVEEEEADLMLTKTVDDATPNLHQEITLTITLTNAGPGTATGVVVSDLLPGGISYTGATSSLGSYDNATGVWTIGTLANGDTATLYLTGTVETHELITNIASVTHSDVYDPNPDNNEDEATVNVPDADLELSKTVDDALTQVDNDITFTVTLTNKGPDVATGVEVQDILPQGDTAYVSDNSGGSYNSATGIWTVGDLAAGETVALEIVAKVTDYGVFDNFAQVWTSPVYDPDSTPGVVADEDDEDAVTVTSLGDVSGVSAIHDETGGVQTDTDTSDPLPVDFDDRIGDLGLSVISSAKSTSNVDFPSGLTNKFLSDAAGNMFSGTDSGFDRTGGGDILLYTDSSNDNIVWGREGSSTGDVIFGVYLGEDDGYIWLSQFEAIEHPTPSDPDEEITVADKIHVTVAIGGDQETSNDAIEFGFQDDGILVDVTQTEPLIHDETYGLQDDDTSEDAP
ncbi:MAG: hypothetical protein AMJ43_05615, partial [Coxiella sp. DG_40]